VVSTYRQVHAAEQANGMKCRRLKMEKLVENAKHQTSDSTSIFKRTE
jgi:hypothetical protein